ncbi:hypothetical protein STXM2123_243 [Streptomyces sp. F-3]|nr:hypothetical protein STXM2123_243 [Streptomyces sp. F-3]
MPQIAEFGTPICGVVVTRRRSASTPSSALHLHAPNPAHLGHQAPPIGAGPIQTTPPKP